MSKIKIAVSTIKIECSQNPRKYDVDFEFMLFVSDDARELFRYYNRTEFHGLNVRECEKRIQSGGTYIDGLVNYHPDDVDCDLSQKPFMFLNLKTMNEQPIWKTAALISHESCHMSIMIETHFGNPDHADVEIEERVVTGMETIAIAVMEKLQFPKIFFQIG
jgi:hypothetical protein